MARERIDTEEKLREYIKRRLGAPQLKVELTDEQLNDCIYAALDRYQEFAHDGINSGSLLLEIERNKTEYTLPDNIVAVTMLKSTTTYNVFQTIPAGYALQLNNEMFNQDVTIDVQNMIQNMAKMSNIRAMFDLDVNFTFNSNTKILKFFEPVTSPYVLMEVGIEYEPKEVDNIYNNMFIKERSVGEAWIMLSTVLGKYSSNLISGTTVNYDDMRSRGEAIIEKSDEDLIQQQDPLGIYVF